MTEEQLRAATGASGNQMRTTLHWLKKTRVVEAMEAEGKLWWYLTGDDQRTKHVEERAREEPGSRATIRRARRRKDDPPLA